MRRCCFLPFALALCIIFSGCADGREVDSLATVMAVGVDKTDSQRLYTFAVADTGSTTGDTKGDEANLLCFSSQADSIDEAIDKVDMKISKKLNFSHLCIILFSEDVSYDGMYEDAQYFHKKIAVRPQTSIASVDSKANEFLANLKPSLEANPERYFENIFRSDNLFIPRARLSDFFNACHTDTLFLVPVISSSGTNHTEENTVISKCLLSRGGTSIDDTSELWLLGLWQSQKEVMYGTARLKSTKKPKMEIQLMPNGMDVSVIFTLSSQGDVEFDVLEREAEAILENSAANGYDIFNIRERIKGKFLLQKSYDEFDFDRALRHTVFDVIIRKGDAKDDF